MSTKPALRIAQPDEVTSVEMGDAIMALARECAAMQPTAVIIAWERADTNGTVQIICRSIPDSRALRQGMVDIIFDEYHPQEHCE